MANMIKKLLASGVAAKVVQEARKPQNQEKVKQLITQFQQKRKGTGGGTGRTR